MPREYIWRLLVKFLSSLIRCTYIHFGAVHTTSCRAHFWSRVVCRSNTSGHIVRLKAIRCNLVNRKLPTRGQTKISDFYVIDAIRPIADEDVFWFQVTVYNTETVNMGQTLKYLAEQPPNFGRILVQVARYQIS